MELFYFLATITLTLLAGAIRADTEGQREVPQEDDMFAPNSVPMMGKKAGSALYRLYRLKKAEEESPFVYKTPWHIGKRSSIPDIYTASWIGSLFKPSSADIENKPNRRMKRVRPDSNKGKKSAMSWEWDNLMRGSPGFRFNDNQNYLYDRDIMHKRNSEGKEEKEEIALPSNLEEWGDFNDFTGLMEDVSLYPASLGLFDRTILTRVQKRPSQNQEETEVHKRELTETPPMKNKDSSVSASPHKPGLKSSLPNDFLFNPWSFDSLNYGR